MTGRILEAITCFTGLMSCKTPTHDAHYKEILENVNSFFQIILK